MTPEKTKEALRQCRKFLQELPAKKSDTSRALFSKQVGMMHLVYMLDEAEKFVDEAAKFWNEADDDVHNSNSIYEKGTKKMEKAMRWLGFVQGALWMEGFCSIDELKDMNKPEGSS